MFRNLRRCPPIVLGLFLAAAGCGGQNEPDNEDLIPPGVSLDPPRTAPASGALAPPGETDADTGTVGAVGDTTSDLQADLGTAPAMSPDSL